MAVFDVIVWYFCKRYCDDCMYIADYSHLIFRRKKRDHVLEILSSQ